MINILEIGGCRIQGKTILHRCKQILLKCKVGEIADSMRKIKTVATLKSLFPEEKLKSK